METQSPEAGTPLRRRVGELPAPLWLELWEGGQGLTSAQRALAWLHAARLQPEDDPAQWRIADRDSQLLLLRESAFGLQMEGSAECPNCSERLELRFTTRELLPQAMTSTGPVVVDSDGHRACFRLPVAGDLARLTAMSIAGARDQVLAACCLSAEREGAPIAFAELPESVCAAAEAEMARQDPDATIELQLSCPACEQAWAQLFDPAAFLWREVEAWARRTLSEVHSLATQYGWTEREILQLSPTRRQFYLSLIGN